MFSEIPLTARHELLRQLERPKFSRKKPGRSYQILYEREILTFFKEQTADSETEVDDIKVLIQKLRDEPWEYFYRAFRRAIKLFRDLQLETKFEEMLSTRAKEIAYEKGKFGSLFLFLFPLSLRLLTECLDR